jgi:hypothetical protein
MKALETFNPEKSMNATLKANTENEKQLLLNEVLL